MPKHIDRMTSLIEAWKIGDLDAVLAHVTDDIVWHSHVGSPPTLGKAAMRPVLEVLAASMQDVRWRVVYSAESGDRLLVEGIEEFVGTEGQHVALPYMGIMTFRGSLIAEWRDYFDRDLYNKLKAGEASPDYIQQLTSRPGIPA